jgi:putative DNA methylase
VPKKLIEVALPLEEINAAAAREKSIRHGHPSTLHLWWARRPLAACRAILFASLLDDPAEPECPPALLAAIDTLPKPYKVVRRADKDLYPGLSWTSKTEFQFPDKFDEGELARMEPAELRRQKLFSFIEQLVQWEFSNDEETLATARKLIHAATDGNPPPVLDPFAGGGSIPLEAQRLGLEAHASDLNPVAVLINKAMIELPPKFANQRPVHPDASALQTCTGAQGLAEDVRRYGKWMRDEAEKRIGHLYPKAKLPSGEAATVIAWIWARTVVSPNPLARGAKVPLVRSFALSTKKGQEAWVDVVQDADARDGYRFEVRNAGKNAGGPKSGTVSKKGAVCALTGAPMELKYVREQGQAGKLGARLMAIVAEGKRGRIYLSPTEEHERIAQTAVPAWQPDSALPEQALGFRVQAYGMKTWDSLFTDRQLTALTTFAGLVDEARKQILEDAEKARIENPQAYADTVATFLGFLVDKQADLANSCNRWEPVAQCPRQLFARQAIPIVWDFAEGNPLGNSSGSFTVLIDNEFRSLTSELYSHIRKQKGYSILQNAEYHGIENTRFLLSTDPPYYDNVPYADLSDFFYVWLKKTLGGIYPELFGTLLTPKAPELIADPFRHGGKDESRRFFEEGMGRVFARMRETAHPDFPITIIYAFKQTESESGEDDEAEGGGGKAQSSTGWETFLQALIRAGHQITGTWPMRTELANRMRGLGSNALASSIALICRPRPDDAPQVLGAEFQRVLRRELPPALEKLQQGNIAPVDLAQAAIGPGMGVFSRYKAVLEPGGATMTVKAALQLINKVVDEFFADQEGDTDPPTRWASRWFAQFGFAEGPYGTAETLATATAVSVQAMADSGIAMLGGGKVRLLSLKDLPENYDPAHDASPTIWEVTHYLARENDMKGVRGAGAMLKAFRNAHPGLESERARDLAYRLFAFCENKKWSADAQNYNALVSNWPDIEAISQEKTPVGEVDGGLFGLEG